MPYGDAMPEGKVPVLIAQKWRARQRLPAAMPGIISGAD